MIDSRTIILILLVLVTSGSFAQSPDSLSNFLDSLDAQLQEVVIKGNNEVKFEKVNNTYIFDVITPRFSEQSSLANALNVLPMVSVKQNQIYFANQPCVVELNGKRLELPPDEIFNLINSMQPTMVSTIEITANSYKYGTKATVLNIKLKKAANNSTLTLQTNHGFRTEYFTKNTVSYYKTGSKYSNYTGIFYDYKNFVYKGPIETSTSFYRVNSLFNEKVSLYNPYLFSQTNLTPTSKLSLGFSLFASQNTSVSNSTVSEVITLKTVKQKNTGKQFYSELNGNYLFNDSCKLSVSSLIYNAQNDKVLNEFFLNTNFNQNLASPLLFLRNRVDFALVKPKINWLAGFKTEQVNSNTFSKLLNYSQDFVFNEKSYMGYVTGEFLLKEKIYSNINLSAEYIDVSNELKLQDTSTSFKWKRYFPLINFNFNWQDNFNWQHSVSFNNLIQRPDYQNFSAIAQITGELFYQKGSSQIIPSNVYQLNYTLGQDILFFSVNGSYAQNFISNIIEYNRDENRIFSTYRNFKKLYTTDFTSSFNKSFFNDFYYLKINANALFLKIEDPNYIINKATPIYSIDIVNNFLYKNFTVNANYNFVSGYHDGVFYHYPVNYITLGGNWAINKNWFLGFELNDPLKTDKTEQVSLFYPAFKYKSNIYRDKRYFVFILRYTIGKSNIHNIQTGLPQELKRF